MIYIFMNALTTQFCDMTSTLGGVRTLLLNFHWIKNIYGVEKHYETTTTKHKKKLNQFIDKMSIATLTLTFISSSAPSKIMKMIYIHTDIWSQTCCSSKALYVLNYQLNKKYPEQKISVFCCKSAIITNMHRFGL